MRNILNMVEIPHLLLDITWPFSSKSPEAKKNILYDKCSSTITFSDINLEFSVWLNPR